MSHWLPDGLIAIAVLCFAVIVLASWLLWEAGDE